MGQCIFCGGRANSKEDAWPKWLLKLLRTTADEKIPMSTLRHGESVFRHWIKTNSAIQVKNVCRRECNNGWMSRLEDAAKPILSPMILGKAVTLTPSQQLTISAWLTKCAMIFDSKDAGEVFYNGLDRLHFKNTLSPSLENTNVWLARSAGTTGLRAFTDHRTLRSNLRRSGNPIKFHVHTMGFGFLVLQIVCVRRLVQDDRAIGVNIKLVSGPWDDNSTVQIWPTPMRNLRWPPPLCLDDSEQHLKLFSNRFGGSET